MGTPRSDETHFLCPPRCAAGGKFANEHSLYGRFCREFRSDPLVDPLLHKTHFCVGHFDAKLAKFGFRGGSKRENDVNRSPTLKKWGPPLTGQPKKA